MLKFNEVKRDIKAGYEYMEYDGKWGDWDYIIYIDSRYEDVDIIFMNGDAVAGIKALDFGDFLKMKYKDWKQFCSESIFYTSIVLSDL